MMSQAKPRGPVAGARIGPLACLVVLTACATNPQSNAMLAPGARYVAMGSSFAAGPGLTTSADTPPNRCGRSSDNYAHQLARKRGLTLVDVSCSGAMTANVLRRWAGLPPQIDALTPDTRLVTVTIGGNDLGYVASLYTASCVGAGDGPRPKFCGAGLAKAEPVTAPTPQAWVKVETALEQIAQGVREKSPNARLVFVDYLTVLPDRKLCAQTPLSEPEAAILRQTAQRLAQITAAVAARTGAQVLKASDLSRGHDACAKAPWVTGFVPPPGQTAFVAYHPNLAGMTAVAAALDRELGR